MTPLHKDQLHAISYFSLQSPDQTHKIEHMSYKWIRASEIGDYIYCRRAWYLRRARGMASQNVRELELGQQHHDHHGRLVGQAIVLRRLSVGLLCLVLLLLLYSLTLGIG